MSTWQIVSALVWVVGVPIIAWLLVNIVRRTREINRRIAELREEEKRNAQNPYAAMAQLYEAQQLIEQARNPAKSPKPARTREKAVTAGQRTEPSANGAAGPRKTNDVADR